MIPLWAVLLGLLLSQALGVSPARAGEVAGTARVVDGDTLVVGGRMVDLAAIDAPEMGQDCVRGESHFDCGDVARAQLMNLTAGNRVVCDDAGWCASGGNDLSEHMLNTGWAVAAAGAPEALLRRQEKARAGHRGLWGFTLVQSSD